MFCHDSLSLHNRFKEDSAIRHKEGRTTFCQVIWQSTDISKRQYRSGKREKYKKWYN